MEYDLLTLVVRSFLDVLFFNQEVPQCPSISVIKLRAIKKKEQCHQAFVVASLHTGKCQMFDKIIATFSQ